MKRTNCSTLILLLFGIFCIVNTTLDIYQAEQNKKIDKIVNSINWTVPTDSTKVSAIMQDGDIEIAKSDLRMWVAKNSTKVSTIMQDSDIEIAKSDLRMLSAWVTKNK